MFDPPQFNIAILEHVATSINYQTVNDGVAHSKNPRIKVRVSRDL